MGVFAALRQELLDAQHYRDVKAAYGKNPRGVRRPDYDPSLEALQPVLSGQEPVIMQANTEREIKRALDLAKEFKLRAIIAGGTEAYQWPRGSRRRTCRCCCRSIFPGRRGHGRWLWWTRRRC